MFLNIDSKRRRKENYFVILLFGELLELNSVGQLWEIWMGMALMRHDAFCCSKDLVAVSAFRAMKDPQTLYWLIQSNGIKASLHQNLNQFADFLWDRLVVTMDVSLPIFGQYPSTTLPGANKESMSPIKSERMFC